MSAKFTNKEIQNAICLLCSPQKQCPIFSESKRQLLIENHVPCIFRDMYKDYDENSVEVIAICKWLYSDNPSSDGYFDIK